MLRAPVRGWRIAFPQWTHPDGIRPSKRIRANDGATCYRWKSSSRRQPPRKNAVPFLMEQLFPEEAKRMNEAQKVRRREIPRLPIEPTPNQQTPRNLSFSREEEAEYAGLSGRAKQARRDMVQQSQERGEEMGVLVLRNASLNLTEEDFRRLIPRGKHIEGWTLEQGDIVKIVPARSMSNLEQKPWYYLLFSSQLGAFTYQGHVSRCHRLAEQQMPRALDSPLPPPPGYMLEGMDAHAVLKDFALVPAGQKLELVHLKPPLAPMIELIASHEGYPALVRRSDKMPHELRLTMEGPQLSGLKIRHILAHIAMSRRVHWSGGTAMLPQITEWIPFISVADANRDERSKRLAYAQLQNLEERRASLSSGNDTQNLHTKVYILGFETEQAAQYFRSFWHRRALVGREEPHDASDLPPIANLEILW